MAVVSPRSVHRVCTSVFRISLRVDSSLPTLTPSVLTTPATNAPPTPRWLLLPCSTLHSPTHSERKPLQRPPSIAPPLIGMHLSPANTQMPASSTFVYVTTPYLPFFFPSVVPASHPHQSFIPHRFSTSMPPHLPPLTPPCCSHLPSTPTHFQVPYLHLTRAPRRPQQLMCHNLPPTSSPPLQFLSTETHVTLVCPPLPTLHARAR